MQPKLNIYLSWPALLLLKHSEMGVRTTEKEKKLFLKKEKIEKGKKKYNPQ